MKISNLIIKLFICIFSLSIFCVNHSISQDSQVIKKIIIDDSQNSERLLSPPTENKSDVIKLIPPKSILEKEVLRKKNRRRDKSKRIGRNKKKSRKKKESITRKKTERNQCC